MKENVIKAIMLVSGALTFTMIFAAIAPDAALRSSFGEAGLAGPVAEIVVRNWGGLIALVGAMLMYGAFHPPVRGLVLVVGVVSKTLFITLVLTLGRQFLGHGVGFAVVVDAIMIVLFVTYLLGARRGVAVTA